MTMDITKVTSLNECYFGIDKFPDIELLIVVVVTKDFWNANHSVDSASLPDHLVPFNTMYEEMEAVYSITLNGGNKFAAPEDKEKVIEYLTSLGMEYLPEIAEFNEDEE